MSRDDIAKEIGTSVASLKRAFRGTRLAYFNRYVSNPALVENVCAFYEKHGKNKTQEKFPDINVRSVVERYKEFNPRQIRWTDRQIIESARMGGFVSPENQAKFFKRPNANVGSIKSLWSKRFKCGSHSINGMAKWMSKELVDDKCPWVSLRFGKIALWVDMEKHLKQDNPKFIKEAIGTLAEFQRWLFKSDNPKRQIRNMIEKREITA